MQATGSRRLLLRVALKLLALGAFLALLAALFASLIPPGRPREPLALPVDHLAPDQVARADWQGRRLLLLRRPAPVAGQLPLLEEALADPRSRRSEQPDAMRDYSRSAVAEFFLALDYDPDFGCPLDYVPAAGAAPVRPWFGGFHSPCSDSWFDPAGRVYRNQRTLHNLHVPPHRFDRGRLVLEE